MFLYTTNFKQTLNFSRFTERMWRWCFFNIHVHYFDASAIYVYGPYTCFIVVHLTTNGFLSLFMREVCCTLSHFLMHFGHSYDCSIEYFSARRFMCALTKRKSNWKKIIEMCLRLSNKCVLLEFIGFQLKSTILFAI